MTRKARRRADEGRRMQRRRGIRNAGDELRDVRQSASWRYVDPCRRSTSPSIIFPHYSLRFSSLCQTVIDSLFHEEEYNTIIAEHVLKYRFARLFYKSQAPLSN